RACARRRKGERPLPRRTLGAGDLTRRVGPRAAHRPRLGAGDPEPGSRGVVCPLVPGRPAPDRAGAFPVRTRRPPLPARRRLEPATTRVGPPDDQPRGGALTGRTTGGGGRPGGTGPPGLVAGRPRERGPGNDGHPATLGDGARAVAVPERPEHAGGEHRAPRRRGDGEDA